VKHRTALHLPFSRTTEHRLLSYAIAAGAAGVAFLAATSPAEAQIVYTPTNLTLTHGSLGLDLDNDGSNDFTFVDRFRSTASWRGRWLDLKAKPGNGIVKDISKNSAFDAAVLNQGSIVGPAQPFGRGTRILLSTNSGTTWSGGRISWSGGDWKDVKDRFLGLRFELNGETHFGWARITVQNVHQKSITLTVLGYAYEATANKPIQAGRTKESGDTAMNPPAAGTLAALALGAAR